MVFYQQTTLIKVIQSVKAELKLRNSAKNEKVMNLIAAGLSRDNKQTILRGKDTGRWLSVLPSTVNNGTELSAQEFSDNVLLRYARSPPDLPSKCDGCNAVLSIRHALECKKGGLVIICHNEIRDELVDLASKAFSPSAVRDEPKIHLCRAKKRESPKGRQDQPVKCLFCNDRNEDRGDVLIRGLWSKGTDCILDVRMTDLDAKSNYEPRQY
jgi:hypothetical protein